MHFLADTPNVGRCDYSVTARLDVEELTFPAAPIKYGFDAKPITRATSGYSALAAAVERATSDNLIVCVAGVELADFVQNWLCSLQISLWAGVASIIVVALDQGLCSAISHLTTECAWCSCVTLPIADRDYHGPAVGRTVVWGKGTSSVAFPQKLEVAHRLLGLRADL